MTLGTGFHWLWPTPIGLHRYANASDVNPLFVRVFGEGRAALQRQRGEEPGPFFGCTDRRSPPSGAPSSISPTRTCSRRIRTSSRCPDSCCCFRHGSRTKRCPTAVNRTGSSFRSTPASTRPRAIRSMATARTERRHKRSLNSPGQRSAPSLCSLTSQSRGANVDSSW